MTSLNTKMKSLSSKSSSVDDNSGNVTVTLPTIHVTEVLNESTLESLNELQTEMVPCHDSLEEPNFSEDSLFDSTNVKLSNKHALSNCVSGQNELKTSCYSKEFTDNNNAKKEEYSNIHLPDIKAKPQFAPINNVIRIPSAGAFPSFTYPVPKKIPPSFADAMDVVSRRNVMFYLTINLPYSDVRFNPYEFRLVARCPGKNYGILSSEGILRVYSGEITYVTTDQFIREKEIYTKISQLPFFRHFRLRRSWGIWRRCVRARRIQEARKIISAQLLITNSEARKALCKVAELCHELSYRCLIKFPDEDLETVSLQDWVNEQLNHVKESQGKFQKNLRVLLLQILVTTLRVGDEEGEGSDFVSEDKVNFKSSGRSISSVTPRRNISSLTTKVVKISDFMMANTLKDLLLNSLDLTMNTLNGKNKKDTKSLFSIQLTIVDGEPKCTPNYEGFLHGIRVVLKACETSVLFCQQLMPYFSGKESAPEENQILRSILEENSTYKKAVSELQPLMEKIWKNVEENVAPIENLRKAVQNMDEDGGENNVTHNDLSEFGTSLSSVGKLLDDVRAVSDSVEVCVMWLERIPAKSHLIEGLRKQQQSIHHYVTRTFETRIDRLEQEATNCWLGLELSPVTGHQLVTLLNYINSVKVQIDSLAEEESQINEMYSLIQGFEIMIQPEVQTKYEAMKKDMRRLKKTLRRSVMERPGLVTKLKSILEKEVQELDKETEKLTEQVQALRFLRITSDRSEVLKMLSAAENRGYNIRSQASVIAQYQADFQIDVCPFENLAEVEAEIQQKTHLWRSIYEWEAFLDLWQSSAIQTLDAKEIKSTTNDYRNRINELKVIIKVSDVLDHFEDIVQQIELQIPILESLTDSTLRPRHWKELEEIIGAELPVTITLAEAEELNLEAHKETLINVAKKANRQKEMEDKLNKVSKDLEETAVPIVLGYKKDLHVLGDVTYMEHLFMDSEVTFYTLLYSTYARHIKEKSVEWKNILTLMKDTLTSLLVFQKKWLSLEPVMNARSGFETFPMQATIFQTANEFWKSVMERFIKNPKFLDHLKGGVFVEQLNFYRLELHSIHCCIGPLLANRRDTCPRLYLLSDDDLLQLFMNSKDPDSCERYLSTIFHGVMSLLKSTEGDIIAVVSPQQEVLHLSKSVLAHHGVEDWLGRIESGIKATLKRLVIKYAEQELFPLKSNVPIQVIDVSLKLQWNSNIKAILQDQDNKEEHLSANLAKVMKDLNTKIKDFLQKPSYEDISSSTESLCKYPFDSKMSSMDQLDGLKENRLKNLQRIRKVTLFTISKSKTLSFQKQETQKLSRAAQKEKDLMRKSKEEKLEILKQFLPLLRREVITLSLLELRINTQNLINSGVKSTSCFSWMSQLRHEIIKTECADPNNIGGVGVCVKVGAETLDYGFEYLGVPRLSIHSPSTDRVAFNLLVAASRSKCGTIVGAGGNGKFDTIQRISNVVGQQLAAFECSPVTPEKSVRQLLSGAVQGGFWVLLHQPQLLSSSIKAQIALSISNIQRTKAKAIKRCIISGIEMKLVDSFALFFSISTDCKTRQPSLCHASKSIMNSEKKVEQFLQHPIAPFLKSVPTSLPSIASTIESFLIARGFNVDSAFKSKIHSVLTVTAKFMVNSEYISGSFIRILNVVTEISRRNKGEILKTLNQGSFQNEKCNELILMDSLQQVLIPLVSEKDQIEWKKICLKNFNLEGEYSSNIVKTIFGIENKKINKTDNGEISSDCRMFFNNCFTNKILNYILAKIIKVGSLVILSEERWASHESLSVDNSFEQNKKTEVVFETIDDIPEIWNELSEDDLMLHQQCLRLFSQLCIYRTSTLVGLQNTEKTTVLMTLKSALNIITSRKEFRELLLHSSNCHCSNNLAHYKSSDQKYVTTTVLYCGGFSEENLIGRLADDDDDDDEGGIIMKALKRLTEDALKNYCSQQWLIFAGPFPSLSTVNFISRLCPPKSFFSDEAQRNVQLDDGLKILILVDDESMLNDSILRRSPILRFQATDIDPQSYFVKTLVKKFEKEGEVLNQQYLAGKFKEILKEYLSDLPVGQLQTSILQKIFSKLSVDDTPLPVEPFLKRFEIQLASVKSLRVFSSKIRESKKEKHFTVEQINESAVIVTEELQNALDAVQKLLEMSGNILLVSSKGNGLSTFLNYFQHSHRGNNTVVLRYQSTIRNSTESLMKLLLHNLYSFKLPEEFELPTAGEKLFDVSKDEMYLTSPENKQIILIVEGLSWPKAQKEAHLELLETLRSMLECHVIMDPSLKIPFRFKNIKLILCLSEEASFVDKPMRYASLESVPEYLLRHCFSICLPMPSIKLCEQLLSSELQEAFAESGDEGQLIDSLKDTLLMLHRILTLSKESLSEVETFNTLNPAEKICIEQFLEKIRKLSKNFVPTLKHFVRSLKSLKRNSKLLSLNSPELGSYFCNEFSRIYSRTSEDKPVVYELAEYIFSKFFDEEPDRHLFWLPMSTEEDLFFYAKRNYEDLLKYIEGPASMASYLFSRDLFRDLQTINFTLLENEPIRHMILTGETGVGKLSLLKLGFFCSNNQVVNLNDYDSTELKIEYLQSALKMAGVKKINTSIVIRYCNNCEKLFHILYDLLLYAWSDLLWPEPEATGILLDVHESLRKTPMSIHSWKSFIEEQEIFNLKQTLKNNIRQNFHICIRATIEEYHELTKLYPAFMRECSVIHMQNWSPETQREVASRLIDHSEIPQNTIDNVLNAFAIIFETLKKGISEMMKNRWSFGNLHFELPDEGTLNIEKFSKTVILEGIKELTSSDFLECCRVYKNLVNRRKSQLREEHLMFEGGLTRLDNTSENIDELRTELSQLEPELKKTQDEAVKLTGAISGQRNVVAELRAQMSAHEEKVKEKSDVLASMNEEIAAEIKEALPELESAERQIKILDKKDLVEVRVLNKPPELVFQVMSAICLLLNVKCDWPSIKTLLGEPSMTKRLLDLEKDTLGDALLRKLRKFIEYPKFTPDEVGKLSKPCKPLCAWLRALDNYTQVLRNVEPKRSRVMEAERDMNNLLFEQRQLQQKLGHAERHHSEQGARYDACVCRRQQLEGAVKRASGRLQRCTKLATVLADEHSRWTKHVGNLDTKLSCIYGECHLAAVAVAYLGHKESKLRNTILEICQKLVKASGIKLIEENFNLLENLSTEDEIQQWVQAGLYNDAVPLTQAAILFAAQAPVLAIDVHQMLIPWLRRLYEPSGGIELLQPRTKKFKEKFSEALNGSKTTVVIHTPIEPFDNEIRLVLEKKSEKTKSKKSVVIFVTESSLSIPSELRIDVNPVSFAVSPGVLEEQLLNRVLERERLDLYEQRTVLSASVMKDNESLRGVDLSILKRLSEASIGLLDNEELLAAFYEAKAASAEYRTRLAESKRTLLKISNARDKYRPVAARGRVLFSSIRALAKLQSEYIFSLSYFLKLFEECTAGGSDEEVAMSFDQRIESLVLNLTQKISSHVTRAIKPPHRLVFLASLAASVECEEGNLSLETWKAVIQKEVSEADKFLAKICEADEEMKLVCKMLREEKVIQLNLYCVQTEIGVLGAKGPIHFTPKKISNFNSLLLLRLHRPRLLLVGAREVVKNILRASSILEISLSLNSLLDSKDRNTGLLLWTDYSKDILSEILTCAREKSVDGKTWIFNAHSQSGQQTEVGIPDISSAIDSAVSLGQWIVIQECSSKSLLPQLLGLMTRINSPNTKVHENFRLILTAKLGSSEPMDDDLILLTRPFQTVPSPEFTGVLQLASEAMNNEWYEKHYQGAKWRRIMWTAAAVHTVVYVAQWWQNYNENIIPNGNKMSPYHFNWVQLKDIAIAYDILYQMSLEVPIDEEFAIKVLASLYGHQRYWIKLVIEKGRAKQNLQSVEDSNHVQNISQNSTNASFKSISQLVEALQEPDLLNRKVKIRSSLPESIGLVSKEAAFKLVLTHIYEMFQDLSNYILDEEFSSFIKCFAAVSEEIMKE